MLGQNPRRLEIYKNVYFATAAPAKGVMSYKYDSGGEEILRGQSERRYILSGEGADTAGNNVFGYSSASGSGICSGTGRLEA